MYSKHSTPQSRPTPTETDIAYLAGLLDGEGSLQIAVVKPNRPHLLGKHVNFLTIYNTHHPVLEWAKATFDCGNVLEYKRDITRRSRCYGWQIHSADAAWLLTLLLPYLHIKRPHAEVMLAFRHETMNISLGGRRPLTPEMFAKRDEFRHQLKALNSRYRPTDRSTLQHGSASREERGTLAAGGGGE